jgi:hypothetical protein
MLLILFNVDQRREVAVDFDLSHRLYDQLDGLLGFQSISQILEVQQLLSAKQI